MNKELLDYINEPRNERNNTAREQKIIDEISRIFLEEDSLDIYFREYDKSLEKNQSCD